MLTIVNARQLNLPDSPQRWLEQLGSSTIIEVDGEDTSCWRVVSVLVHGNEPSGFFAAYEFLKNELIPKTNLAIVIASVRAARHSPQFTHRFVPGEFDLNRRFGNDDCHDRVTELARQITEYIRSKHPLCVIDLHNTSGNSPAFAVSVKDDLEIKRMASVFTKTMVITRLVVGSLMEQDFDCPIVTIECGGANNSRSHKIAYQGLLDFARQQHMPPLEDVFFETFQHPMRVELRSGISLDYGEYKNQDVAITLRQDIEKLNFVEIEKATRFGWVNRHLADCLRARNENGDNVIEQLFEVKNNQLLSRQPLRVFMATGRADIALSDCLFYAVCL